MTDIDGLLPHAGSARLLDKIVSFDDRGIVATTSSHRSPHNPLRLEGRLGAAALVEYAAQAMALHGALRDRAAGRAARPALLAAVRDVVIQRARIDDLAGDLTVSAVQEITGNRGWQYRFEVRHEGEILATGRAAAIVDVPGK